ncbi:MAG TPA: prepilin-type N-terminal cleavage/methylation domain-containing protein [Rhodocyclaceae bacterium]|nr:prepilin-type N-terminal cleavage/methylation domain-containing protein [Rhodocyclaceae bacterium]
MPHRQPGFTLVEIAIVLVIVGLLLGGVLKGQELINSARIRNLANDFGGTAAAVYAYQDRYASLPGDDSGASLRWGADVPSGDRGGTVAGEFCADPGGSGESVNFWRHLRLSGLVAGDPATNAQPQNALGGVIGVQTGTGPVAAIEIGGLVLCSTNLSAKIAEALDIQIDDGRPGTGSLRAYSQHKNAVTRGCPVNITRSAALANTDGYHAADESELYTVCKSI